MNRAEEQGEGKDFGDRGKGVTTRGLLAMLRSLVLL